MTNLADAYAYGEGVDQDLRRPPGAARPLHRRRVDAHQRDAARGRGGERHPLRLVLLGEEVERRHVADAPEGPCREVVVPLLEVARAERGHRQQPQRGHRQRARRVRRVVGSPGVHGDS